MHFVVIALIVVVSFPDLIMAASSVNDFKNCLRSVDSNKF